MAAVTFRRHVYRERIVEFPNRRELVPVEGVENTVTVHRAEGIIQQEGDQWAPTVMTGLEDRIEESVNGLDTKIDEEIAGTKSIVSTNYNTLNTRISTEVSTLNTKINTDIANARPIKTPVTVTASGWETVTDGGQTVYRKTTGVTGNATDLPILGIPPGQIAQLTSSPSLVNDNGTIYIYSAQIPNISLTVTVTKLQSR